MSTRFRQSTAPRPKATVVRMSRRRLEALIDREARNRLNMSGKQFQKRLAAGALSKDCGTPEGRKAWEIEMLVKLLGKGKPRT